jgi:hypothetical protein
VISNNGNGYSYQFDSLSASDIIITQTAAQKEKNVCDMRIDGAPIRMYDVADCEELKAYITAKLK